MGCLCDGAVAVKAVLLLPSSPSAFHPPPLHSPPPNPLTLLPRLLQEGCPWRENPSNCSYPPRPGKRPPISAHLLASSTMRCALVCVVDDAMSNTEVAAAAARCGLQRTVPALAHLHGRCPVCLGSLRAAPRPVDSVETVSRVSISPLISSRNQPWKSNVDYSSVWESPARDARSRTALRDISKL